MSSKLFKTMLIILGSLTVLGVGALIFVLNLQDSNADEKKERTIDEIIESSFVTQELTTDLDDGRFVRIQFRIITDSKDAVEEIQKREFQLKNILIKELTTMSESDFKTGLSNLETMIKLRLNQLMNEGQITDVYTINKVLQ